MQGNADGELRWQGQLNKNIQRELKRLETNFTRLCRTVDKLLPYLGLWQSLKLSYLSQWLCVQCPEVHNCSMIRAYINSLQELINYFNQMHDQWSKVLRGNSPEMLDHKTISLLETLLPEYSLHDRALIREMIEGQKLFPLIEDGQNTVLNQILSIHGRILSFHTFTRDFIYFEACSTALRRLLPARFKHSVSTEFLFSYTGINQDQGSCRIQVGETRMLNQNRSPTVNPRLGYQQLFLATMRDFPSLTGLNPYCNDRNTKPQHHGSEAEALLNLANLAFQLGFENKQIREIREWAGENIIAWDLLHYARPLQHYSINKARATEMASYIRENLHLMAELQEPTSEPIFTTDLEKQPKKFQCS